MKVDYLFNNKEKSFGSIERHKDTTQQTEFDSKHISTKYKPERSESFNSVNLWLRLYKKGKNEGGKGGQYISRTRWRGGLKRMFLKSR